MADFTLMAGDLLPIFSAVCRNPDGTTVDWTQYASASLYMRHETDPAAVTHPLTLGALGACSYAWTAGDTATAGTYFCQIRAVSNTGKPEHFPNNDTFRIVILSPVT